MKEYTKASIESIAGGYRIVLSFPGNWDGRYAGVWERAGFKYIEDANVHLDMINEDLIFRITSTLHSIK